MRARQFGEEARSGGCFLGSEHGRLGWEHGAWFYDGSADMRADESVVLRSERPPATL